MGKKEEGLIGVILAITGILLLWIAFSNSLQNKVPLDVTIAAPSIVVGIVLLGLGYFISRR